MSFAKSAFFFSLIFLCSFNSSFAQEKYWVFFTDKKDVEFNPYEYFDGKAIERRLLHNLPLNDPTDWPVNQGYLASVTQLCETILQTTRWFNGAAIKAYPHQLQEIQSLPFIKSIKRIQSDDGKTTAINKGSYQLSTDEQYVLRRQTQRMQAEDFRQNGINGEGIRIAVFDAGFPGVDDHPAFEHIRQRNGIIATYDFVKNKELVYKYSSHGTSVLSCIAGKHNDKIVGLATGAEFLLARTEIAGREPFSEEENWLAAAEWADKNGAQIINSSLAYTFHRYFPHEMDGKRTFIARAANMAAAKGILVVNAAGNDGDNRWKKIGSPGDADSVLTVGGIDPYSDYHIDFSSFGPTADFRMKPNVSALGSVVAADAQGMHSTQGTSFASPLVAGFAACALQMHPNYTAMKLFREIEKSGHLYPYFDYAHGFGIPQASYFTTAGIKKEPAFHLDKDQFVVKVIIDDMSEPEINLSDTTQSLQDVLAAISKTMDENKNYLYYHLENSKGYLDKYYVIQVDEKVPLQLFTEDYNKGDIVRIHYKGQTETHKF